MTVNSDITERAEALLGGLTMGDLDSWAEHCQRAFAFIGNADFATHAPKLIAELVAELKSARIERDKTRIELSRLRRIAIQSLVDCTEMAASWWRKLPASDPRAQRPLARLLGHSDEEHEAWVKDPHGFFAARLDRKR